MPIKVGDKVPDVPLKHSADGFKDVTIASLGKKVVIFAVPGAFTPTCSKTHAPGFLKQAAALRAKGVDAVACISVNDPFVMQAWQKDLGATDADGVLFLADGNGEFTKAVDLELDGTGFNLGTRSQRYAAVIEDGVVTKLAVEPGGGLTCSAAEAVLELV